MKDTYALGMRAFFLALTVLLMGARFSEACNADGDNIIPCKLLAVLEDNENPELDDILELKCEVDGTHVFSIDSDSNPEFQLLRDSPDRNLHGLDLIFRGAYISYDQNNLVLPAEAEFAFTTTAYSDGGSGRRLGGRDPIGDQKVMVVYFRDSTGKTPSRPADGVANSIEDDIFGGFGDQYNLGTVYENCSNGHVDFKPFIGNTSTGVAITNGVHTVDLTMAVTGADRKEVENNARTAATTALGDLSSQFDYGGSLRSGGDWIGYAYIDSWLGVYNDGSCSDVSTLTHEIGHNLNLGHSGTPNGGQYGDTIGFMGYGYGLDDRPIKCFNGPKTHQLKWFESFHADLDLNTGFKYTGNLYGFIDEDNIAATETQKMIVKLDGTTNTQNNDFTDFYVSFNLASGVNSGTSKAANKVVIHKAQNPTKWAPKSTLVAELSVGDTEIIEVRGVEVTVVCTAIDLNASPKFATVSIYSEPTSAPSVSNSPSLSLSPSAGPSTTLQPSISPAPTVSSYSVSTEYLFGEFYVDSKGGVMFDVTATEEIGIEQLDISLFYPGPPAVDTDTVVELWVKDGTYNDAIQNTGNQWEKHMDATTVQGFTTGLLTTITIPTLFIGAGSTKALFLTNLDSKNFIKIASANNARDHTDGRVTISPGRFSKYNYFQGTGGYNLCGNVPFQFAGTLNYKLTANMPTTKPSAVPSMMPSLSSAPSAFPSVSPSLQPSLSPSDEPSAEPTLSKVPSTQPSSEPTMEPSLSSAPSLQPSSEPSMEPSVSSAPSLVPSQHPSDLPSLTPSISPSNLPTVKASYTPTQSPTKGPTKNPTKSPTTSPTALYWPSASPTETQKPSMADTEKPTGKPTELQRFQVLKPRCYCRSPLRGISSTELSLRFSLMVAIWEAAVTAALGPDKSNWKTTVISMGNRDVRRRGLLEISSTSDDGAQLTTRFLQNNDEIMVEYELTTTIVCESLSGCSESDQNAALQSSVDTASQLEVAVTTGSLTQALVTETKVVFEQAGVVDIPTLVVDEVEAEVPPVEIVLPPVQDMGFTSILPFDSTTRKFCLQVMNFRVNSLFRMRPCEKWKLGKRQKQLWVLDTFTNQIRNKSRPEFCMTWVGGKQKNLKLGLCNSPGTRKTVDFIYDENAKSLIVRNIMNGKKFVLGYDTVKKYGNIRLYGKNTKNPSAHSFELLFS